MIDKSSQAGEADTIRELVGHVWVDSGQLMVTDPMYLEELDPDILETATNLQQRSRLMQDGMAAVFRSGLRNTKCPVYATRYRNGALAKVEIIFDERLEL